MLLEEEEGRRWTWVVGLVGEGVSAGEGPVQLTELVRLHHFLKKKPILSTDAVAPDRVEQKP